MKRPRPAPTARERTGDEVSAERYGLIADKIEADPSLLDIPLANIARWLANGHSAVARLEGWRAMLLEAKASRAGLQKVLDILGALLKDSASGGKIFPRCHRALGTRIGRTARSH
jgi:hypothetical protein